ncbi:MAG: heparan-alpha-glucosaminide N-acetyltransferase domain-containing protein, partial [Candidatus Thermoplasmatota archaeon]|nr:heparan-alpha-glucosaminide N-acetyltransferase domain-containing protein [Candidatus Thermoplasmatota archaeon]
MTRRLDELDALRGIALGMMLISNFVSDLNFFDIMDVAEGSGWWWFSRLTAGLFVAVAGVAAFLASRKGNTHQVLYRSLRL